MLDARAVGGHVFYTLKKRCALRDNEAGQVQAATVHTFRYGIITMANTIKPAIMPIGLFSHAITLKGTTFCRNGTRLLDWQPAHCNRSHLAFLQDAYA